MDDIIHGRYRKRGTDEEQNNTAEIFTSLADASAGARSWNRPFFLFVHLYKEICTHVGIVWSNQLKRIYQFFSSCGH
jgi:hypothetical protein